MPTAILSPSAKQQFTTDGSTLAAGYRLYTLNENGGAPQATYTDRAGLVPNANPIILNARGEATIYLTPGLVYTYVLKTNEDVTVWTQPGVSANAGDADAVSFTQAGTGAISRSSQDKMRERVSVLDYIPTTLHAGIQSGSNTTDLLPYITAARDACVGMTRAKLVFPPGFYRISNQVVFSQQGLHIVGEGGAQIISTSATAHMFVIGDGSNNPAQICVRGLYFKATSAKTDGAAIYLRNGNHIEVGQIVIAENTHDGVVFEGGPGQFAYFLHDFLITNFSGDAIRLQNAGANLVSDVHIWRGTIGGGNVVGTNGLMFLAGSGTYVDGIDIIGCDKGVYTNPSDQVLYSFFDQVISDTCISDCWSLNDNGGKVLVWNMSNCWGNTSQNGDGLFSGGSAPQSIRNVTISNSVFANNGGNGIELFRTDNHIVTGCIVAGNNMDNVANRAGIKVRAACTDFVLSDNIVDNNYFITPGGNQYFGIEVEGGASNRYTITGNVLRNNITVQMTDGGTGSDKRVTANVGYIAPATAPTLLNAWANAGGSFETAGYWKDADGTVHLKGTVMSGALPGVIFTLPAGYRPAAQGVFPVVSNGAFGRCDVKNSGNVEATTGNNAAFSLDGISFKAA